MFLSLELIIENPFQQEKMASYGKSNSKAISALQTELSEIKETIENLSQSEDENEEENAEEVPLAWDRN